MVSLDSLHSVCCDHATLSVRLTRDEEDQIFLDDSFNHERTAQAAIADRVNKIQPIVKASIWLAGTATVLLVLYYIYDIFNQFK